KLVAYFGWKLQLTDRSAITRKAQVHAMKRKLVLLNQLRDRCLLFLGREIEESRHFDRAGEPQLPANATNYRETKILSPEFNSNTCLYKYHSNRHRSNFASMTFFTTSGSSRRICVLSSGLNRSRTVRVIPVSFMTARETSS